MKYILSLLLVVFCHLNASPQESYNAAMDAYKRKDWKELLKRCESFHEEFPTSDFVGDVCYYEGLAYFHLGDYDFANQRLSAYLENYASEKFFEEVFAYKYEIANKFEAGERLHMFGTKHLPKWVWPGDQIIALYDEIIKTLPRHDLAAKSLFRKGSILFANGDDKEAVEVFQTLIRKFPKHPLTPDAYIEIAKVYLDGSNSHFTDADLVDLSEINLRNFYHAFPHDKRVSEVQDHLLALRNNYAKDVWDTAEFFVGRKKMGAAVLYYRKLLQEFPESTYAKDIPAKLQELKKKKKPAMEVIALLEEMEGSL